MAGRDVENRNCVIISGHFWQQQLRALITARDPATECNRLWTKGLSLMLWQALRQRHDRNPEKVTRHGAAACRGAWCATKPFSGHQQINVSFWNFGIKIQHFNLSKNIFCPERSVWRFCKLIALGNAGAGKYF